MSLPYSLVTGETIQALYCTMFGHRNLKFTKILYIYSFGYKTKCKTMP